MQCPDVWQREVSWLPLCSLLASAVVASIKPNAILLTGDLVDGKERNHHGRQLQEEWQVLIAQQDMPVSAATVSLVRGWQGNDGICQRCALPCAVVICHQLMMPVHSFPRFADSTCTLSLSGLFRRYAVPW